MKKVCLFSLVLALCSISFFGCKNFMESEDFLTQLNDSVKYSNAPYAHVEIKADSHAILSIIPAVGEYNSHFKAGDKITLKFEEQEAYNFVEWVATPENAVIFDDAKECSTKAKIVSVEEPIVIEAYTVLRDKLQVKFTWDQGSVSVPSSSSFYLDEEFSFRYNPNNDYAFVRWEIIDGKGNVRNDILQLSGNGIDETAKVLKVNENITIKAVSSKRPKVVSYSPLFTSDGVYRDRRIVVMFDQDIDESSIYFDENEQKELRAEGCTLVFDTVEGRKDKCYAYKDKAGNLFWKNITIVLRKVGTSYLEYYNAPFFDANDKSILYIDPKIDNPPPGGKEVLVVVNQKMLSAKEKIELAGECSWAYFTNGGIDKDGPKFSDDFKVTFDDNNVKSKIENMNELQQNKVSKNKITMTVKGSYVDDGAGAGGLKYQVVQVDSPYYSTSKKVLPNGAISVEIAKANATVIEEDDANKIEIDLRDEYFDEGIYRIDIIASDCNGKDTFFDNQYYFVKDNTPPEEPLVYSGSLNNGVRLFIDMSEETAVDIKSISISGHDEATIDINNNNIVDKIFTKELSNGQKWDYTVIVSDYAGNETEVSISADTGIKSGYCCYLTDKNTIYFSANKDSKIGKLQGYVVNYDDDTKYVEDDILKVLAKDIYQPNEVKGICTISFINETVISNQYDGLQCYKDILKLGTEFVEENYPLIDDIYKDINKEGEAPIIWYVPSIDELLNNALALNSKIYKKSGFEDLLFKLNNPNNARFISSSFCPGNKDGENGYCVGVRYTKLSNTDPYQYKYDGEFVTTSKLNSIANSFNILLMAQVDPTK